MRKGKGKAKGKFKGKGKGDGRGMKRGRGKGKAKAGPKTKMKVKARAKTRPKPLPRVKLKAKPQVEPKTTVEAKAAPGTEPKPKAETKEKAKAFVPRIVVFACNWCSYAGADNAGVNRIQYSPHFRVIRTMCSGRVHPNFVLRAFERGADGVLVSGCHIGDCHYIFGNERAVETFEKTKALVKTLGLEEGRIRLEWISAAEGPRFGQVIDEFVEQVRSLGRSPLVEKTERASGR